MTDLTDQHIISSILEKTGILENKSLLVEIIEDEIKLEMMERFDVVEIKPTDDNDRTRNLYLSISRNKFMIYFLYSKC